MTGTEKQKTETENRFTCPGCGCDLELEAHADLVCDGQVWCTACRQYPATLSDNLSFNELKDWCKAICAAFGQEPVQLLEDPEAKLNWRLYWHNETCLMAEAYHNQRAILLYPPGQRLTTLCHELAHIFTGQDHTPDWAESFSRLISWVKQNL